MSSSGTDSSTASRMVTRQSAAGMVGSEGVINYDSVGQKIAADTALFLEAPAVEMDWKQLGHSVVLSTFADSGTFPAVAVAASSSCAINAFLERRSVASCRVDTPAEIP